MDTLAWTLNRVTNPYNVLRDEEEQKKLYEENSQTFALKNVEIKVLEKLRLANIKTGYSILGAVNIFSPKNETRTIFLRPEEDFKNFPSYSVVLHEYAHVAQQNLIRKHSAPWEPLFGEYAYYVALLQFVNDIKPYTPETDVQGIEQILTIEANAECMVAAKQNPGLPDRQSPYLEGLYMCRVEDIAASELVLQGIWPTKENVEVLTTKWHNEYVAEKESKELNTPTE